MSDTVIRVENIGKRYKLGLVVHDRLAEVISSRMKKIYDSFRHLAGTDSGDSISDKSGNNRQIANSDSLPDYIWAVRGVSFNIKQGEIVGIIGKNGAGKSTLLKILTGITEPTEGKIWMKGRVGSLLEVGTGFHPELTGRENIFLNGAILGMSRAEIKKKFDEIVAFAEIEKFIDTPVKRYSSGMYVRLAFAVAAHLEPEILLVDEVLAVGDISFQKKCLGKMGDVAKEGRTILFVSHNMPAITTLCQSCVFLEKGAVRTIGITSEIVNQYLNEQANKSCIPLSERKDREGDGRVQITNIRFLDAKTHQPLEKIFSGQDVCIEIMYCSRDSDSSMLKNFHIGIPFINSLGQFVTVLNSEMASKAFESLPAEGSVYCYIPNFPLMGGTFSVNINLYINTYLSDSVENIATIEVQSGDYFGTGSPNAYRKQGIFIPHYWSKETVTSTKTN